MKAATKDRVVHPAFASRMQQACDDNHRVPLPNYGRLGWLTNELETRFGISASQETMRKWLSGETIPRPKSMKAMAIILGVDEAWLSIGRVPEVSIKQGKLRNATADGAVNVVAGFIQMCGGNPAFPLEDDRAASKEKIDIYAIIKGAKYSFHVTVGERRGDEWHFHVPVEAENTFVIGVARTSDLVCEFYEFDPDTIERMGNKRGGAYEIVLRDGEARRIETFAERL